MTKTTKILLVVSLTSFLVSLTGALWGLFLPVGVICFGLFMISKLLEGEVTRFDEEQRSRIARVERPNGSAPEPASGVEHEGHGHRLVTANHSR